MNNQGTFDDHFEQLGDDEPVLLDYLIALKRRRALFLSVFFSLTLIAFLFAVYLPPIFKSTAIILIEQQEIPSELVQSTITSYADQRIQSISQRVMTSSNLRELIEKYGLYQDEQADEPLEVVLEAMREDINLEMISAEVVDPRSGRPTQATLAFELSFEHKSPAMAQRVTNELSSLYLEENIKSRTEMATETTNFLREEAESLAGKIAKIEVQLANFKEENAESLPEIAGLNREIRERLGQELRDVQSQIRVTQNRVSALEAELAQVSPRTAVYSDTGQRILGPADRLRILESDLVAARARYSASHPTVQRIRREVDALRHQIGSEDNQAELLAKRQDAETKLEFLLTQYGEDHPDVLAAKRTLGGITEAIADSLIVEKAEASYKPDNPIFIRINTQLESARSQQASLAETADQIRTRIQSIEQALRDTPQVEKEYRELVRDHDNATAKFQELRAKQLQAEMSESLESERKGERFTLIEPPLLPEQPVRPNRLGILAIGTIFAVLLSFVSIALRENLDTHIYRPKQVAQIIGTPPLTVIPLIQNEADIKKRKMKLGAYAVGGIAVAIGLAVLLHLAFIPLDVLVLTIARRFDL